MRFVSRNIFSAAVCLCVATMLTGPSVPKALAQGDHKEARAIPARLVDPADTTAVAKRANRYFVDFRSRTAASYGHAFVWYGRLTPQGRIGLVEVAGLHPASDSPIPYVIGHVFPVPSETGKSYGDLDDQYLTANYRVYLSEADAQKVFAYIRRKQETSPIWTAGFFNCTSFITDIAAYMGLHTPLTAAWMYPEDLVKSLRELNGGREEISLADANH
jgi:hypothetical protein